MKKKERAKVADYAANHAFGMLANEVRLFALRGRVLGEVTRVFEFDKLFKSACKFYQAQGGHYVDGSMDPITDEDEAEIYISIHMQAEAWRAKFMLNGKNEKEVAITIVSPFNAVHERTTK